MAGLIVQVIRELPLQLPSNNGLAGAGLGVCYPKLDLKVGSSPLQAVCARGADWRSSGGSPNPFISTAL